MMNRSIWMSKKNNHKASRLAAVMIALVAAVLLLASCSAAAQKDGSGDQVDEANVKVAMSTNPTTVKVGEAVQLRAEVTGLKTYDGASFAFDIRKANWKGLPELIDATLDDNTVYVANKTFTEPGEYYIYLHLYQGELHITKKKEIKVE